MNKTGFTLIEVLVVVLIIGILTSVTFPQYQKAVEKSRMMEALLTINSLKKAIDLYILANGYPTVQVHFLGDNVEKVLVIDFPTTNRADLISYGGITRTKYFKYNAYCSTDYCDIMADRSNDGKNSFYRIFIRYYSNGNAYKSCAVMDNFGIGKQMCAVLQKEGYQEV